MIRPSRVTPILALAAALVTSSALAEVVCVVHDAASPQASYAARKLGEALRERGYEVRCAGGAAPWVSSSGWASTRSVSRPRPSPSLRRERRSRSRAATRVASSTARWRPPRTLRNGTRLEEIRARREAPRLEFRGVKFNTPWDTYRPSSALDQHYATARDVRFWEAFLDMLVENRFNAISLWTLHPFTYMIRPRNFPEASPWTAARARGVAAASTARSSAWRRSAGSTPTSCTGASS